MDQHAADSGALAVALARAGLIQFGQFRQADGTFWPVAVTLRMLPSYPALLRDVAAALAPLVVGAGGERILCTSSAIPVGVALSLHTDLPLVYPYGDDQVHTSAYVFEGAYDVGHPTVLLADVLIDAAQAVAMADLARRVGLDVARVVAVLDLGLGARARLQAAGFEVRTVLAIGAVLTELAAARWLPETMRGVVETWLRGMDDER